MPSLSRACGRLFTQRVAAASPLSPPRSCPCDARLPPGTSGEKTGYALSSIVAQFGRFARSS
jgi:hypothetical protein